MAANDYLMRQIEDMARFLGKVLFVKTEETIPLFTKPATDATLTNLTVHHARTPQRNSHQP